MSRSARPGSPVFAGPPLLVAHRGGADLAPENTLQAFTRAVEWWAADMIELDVRLSRDGELVVMHDATVDRTTDGSGAVSAMTLEELRSLDAGFRFVDPDGRRSFRGRGVEVPTLDEVLEQLPGVRFTVEIKEARAWAKAVETVERYRSRHRVVLASADRRMLDSSGFEGAVGSDRHTVLRLWLASSLGIGRLAQAPRRDILQVPASWRGLRVVSRRFVRAAHARNIPVQVWTVNDPAEMRRLLATGVDGIQSDRPDLLAGVLEEVAGRPPAPGPPTGSAWSPPMSGGGQAPA